MYRSLLYLLIMASVVACTQKKTGEKTEKLPVAEQQEPIETKALNFNDLTWDSLKLDTIDKFVIKTLIQDSAVYTQDEIISFVRDSSLLFRYSFNGMYLLTFLTIGLLKPSRMSTATQVIFGYLILKPVNALQPTVWKVLAMNPGT